MKTLFFLMILLAGSGALAQHSLRGTVMTSENEALPGASVVVEGTLRGTVTDENGRFFLENLGKGDYVIRVSFIGYFATKQSVHLAADRDLKIVLQKSNVLTEEVFVYSTRASAKTPIASTTVDSRQIESQNLGQDVAYLLQTTPSFVSSSDAGTGIGYTSFRIRGTDMNRINVTINGIPLNDPESHAVYWVNMPDFRSSLENIQVQRGVGTSTQGAGAFGATVNMQTRNVNTVPYAEYSGSAGSFRTLKNTFRVGTGLIQNRYSFEARLSKISSDGFIDRAFSDLKSFYLSGGYYTPNTLLKVNVFSGKEITYQAWNGVPSVRLKSDYEGMKRYEEHWLYSARETEEMIQSHPRTYNLYTYENETDNYQQDHYQLLFNHKFSGTLHLNAALHYTRGKGCYEQYKEDEDFADYGADNPVIGNDTLSSTNLIRQKWLDNDFFGGTFSLSHLSPKTEFTLGSGWNKYLGDHFGNVIWAQNSGTMEKDHEWYRNRGVKTDFNVFVKANHAFSEDFNVYADLQYRNILYSIDGWDDDQRDLTQDHTFGFLNPKLGLFFAPNQGSKAWISWAMAHREPSRSNFTDADPEAEAPTFEVLNDFEAGWQFQSGAFSLSANAYVMLYRDQLILTGEINDVGSAILVNVDESYRAGIEVMAGWNILPGLRWDVNATFSRNKILNFTEYVDNWDTWGQDAFALGTTDISFSPGLVANSMLRYAPLKNLEIGLSTQYVGPQYIDNTSSPDRMLDAYFVSNLQLSWSVFPEWTKELAFHLLVNNLFNEEYESNAWVYSYILGGERYTMDGYFPQAGIHFLAGITMRF